ncbi:MAG TPA: histidine kinase [Flavisolibacter sp.]|nr:histidine kinase [Flavisolibacter sp.]
MKEFISRPSVIRQVEFWGATTVYVFAVFFLISNALNIGWDNNASTPGTSPFDYYFVSKLIRFTILYGAFLLLNFRIVPALVNGTSPALNVIITLLLFFVIGLGYGIVGTFLKYEMVAGSEVRGAAHNFIFQKSFLYALWLLLMFGFYSVIKYTGLYLLSRAEAIQSRYPLVTPGGLVAFVLWMICLFFMIVSGAERGIVAGWAVVIPSAILFYWFALHTLIPKSLLAKKPFRSYMAKSFLVLFIALLPTSLLAMLLIDRADPGLVIGMFNGAFHLLVTAPLCWIIYKRRLQGAEELDVLKKELGQSHASFDFLRSQINPHFLFNALNTIYGTALQEGAERTSEGIEKLGDMMRFMLQENMQEKISLAREIEYLNNYISLQKLRTDPNPIVKIDAAIQEPVNPVQIAPMLLIPFVENAFKHGISFQESSHIKVTLEMKERTLYFDVYNSKHVRQEADPEKAKSGIGLTNVKQRLQLLYPKRHELIVRETGKDFFVHLTIQLT